ncbi:methyl-accepting chemotaxis protein [Spirochaetia bacterium]|nr:methyl-accepting chemotaxis protein [Spirochaetia bacterium]
MKIKLRLGIMVIVILALAVLVAAVLLFFSSRIVMNQAIEQARAVAEGRALEVKGYYDGYMERLGSIARVLGGYAAIDPGERRQLFDTTLRNLFRSDKRYVNLYMVWNPDVLDRDALHIGEQGASPTGQFIPRYSREVGWERKLPCPDFEHILSVVTATGAPYLSDIEPRTINKWNTFSFDMVVPVSDSNGNVVAAVGATIGIYQLQPILEAQIRSRKEIVAMAVYNNAGLVIASYVPKQVGKNIREADAALFENNLDTVARAVESGSAGNLQFSEYSAVLGSQLEIVFSSFTISGMKAPWTVMAGTAEDIILEDMQRLRIITAIIAAVFALVSGVLVYVMAQGISKPIERVAHTLKDISEGEGDLTREITIRSQDEVGDLSHYFNLTLQKIRNLVITIKQQADTLSLTGNGLASNMNETASAVNEIAANIQSIKGQVINQSSGVTATNAAMEQITTNIGELNTYVEDQADSVAQSSSAIEEMLANIQSVTATLVKNAGNVQELAESSEVGRAGLQNVAADIREIARESEGLLEINAVMENIASQTNLLSMNAAIEAAHAGEAGKGFAVVSGEIRKLAETSAAQSKTISAVLKKIKESIDKITRSTNEVLDKFEAISGEVQTVSNQEESIRNAMEEQGTGSRQILEALSRLNSITQLVKDSSAKMLEGSKEVIQEGKNLETITLEITSGMNEMSAGANHINTAVDQVHTITGKNRENIDTLVTAVSRFKV